MVLLPQLNGLETYGPPAGVVFRSGAVCDQPSVETPPSAGKELEAGPEVASETAFWIENDPRVTPR